MVESLANTMIDMLSDDPKQQFRAEYQQLVFRTKDLSKYLKETELDEEHKRYISRQLKAMYSYMYMMEHRAKLDHIDLN
jgi:flagellin-specific chaperone FliS